MVKKKTSNKKKPAKKEKINSEVLKKFIGKIKQERPKVEEVKPKEETLEEEIEEPEFFQIPLQNLTQKRRTNTNLEETFQIQDSAEEFSLEDSLAGVEIGKKDSREKDFYQTISYGTKTEDPYQKYGSPIQTTTAETRQREIGPLTVADVKLGTNTLTGLNPEVMSEVRKYASQDSDEKYSVGNLGRLDPNDMNRDKGRNPFLREAERVGMKYE